MISMAMYEWKIVYVNQIFHVYLYVVAYIASKIKTENVFASSYM